MTAFISLLAINIFPVKGLGGIARDQALCTPRGLQFDRRYMVVDRDNEFVTQREHPQMATIRTAIDGDALTLNSPLDDPISLPLSPSPMRTRPVRVWRDTVDAHGVEPVIDEWLSDHLGLNVRLVYMPESSHRPADPRFAPEGSPVSFADGYPVLLAQQSSLDDLNERIQTRGGEPVPMSRFRANLIVAGGKAFEEDHWTHLAVGEARFRNAKPCARCQVTTIDQEKGEQRGAEPLQTLGTFRNSPDGVRFGINLVVQQTGYVRVGDALTIRP